MDTSEVRLNGLGADRERARDLSIGATTRRQLSNPLLRWRELVAVAPTDSQSQKLSARLVAPELAANLDEGLERGVEACSGGTALTVPPLQLAQDQQRAGSFERHRQPVVLRQCQLAAFDRLSHLAACAEKQAAAPSCHGQRPGPVEAAAMILQPVDDRGRFIQSADRVQGDGTIEPGCLVTSIV